MEHTYSVYVSTYEAVANAMLRDDVSALRLAWLAASFRAGSEAIAAAAAQVDAANRLPMCSEENLRRVLDGRDCALQCRVVAR